MDAGDKYTEERTQETNKVSIHRTSRGQIFTLPFTSNLFFVVVDIQTKTATLQLSHFSQCKARLNEAACSAPPSFAGMAAHGCRQQCREL